MSFLRISATYLEIVAGLSFKAWAISASVRPRATYRATSVWRRLAKPASFDQLRGALVGEYDVSEDQCTAELRGLLDDLVERGLIRIVS